MWYTNHNHLRICLIHLIRCLLCLPCCFDLWPLLSEKTCIPWWSCGHVVVILAHGHTFACIMCVDLCTHVCKGGHMHDNSLFPRQRTHGCPTTNSWRQGTQMPPQQCCENHTLTLLTSLWPCTMVSTTQGFKSAIISQSYWCVGAWGLHLLVFHYWHLPKLIVLIAVGVQF